MKRGALVMFEGADGCGKSSVAQGVLGRLREAGVPAILAHSLEATEIGRLARRCMYGDSGSWASRLSVFYLMLASNRQFSEQVVEPALERGYTVLVDRWWFSTAVYQLGVDGIGLDEHYVACLLESCNRRLGDLTVVLEAPLTVLADRLKRRDNVTLVGNLTLSRLASIQDWYRRLGSEHGWISKVYGENFKWNVMFYDATQDLGGLSEWIAQMVLDIREGLC